MALISFTFSIKSVLQPLDDPGIPPESSNLAAFTSYGWWVSVDLPSAATEH